MSNEELVDIVAETIYNHLRDKGLEESISFYKLSDKDKDYYRLIAHDVINACDDYYDEEIEDIEDCDEEEMIDDDPYGKVYDEDWYDL